MYEDKTITLSCLFFSRVSDASGQVEVNKVKEGDISKDDLDSGVSDWGSNNSKRK